MVAYSMWQPEARCDYVFSPIPRAEPAKGSGVVLEGGAVFRVCLAAVYTSFAAAYYGVGCATSLPNLCWQHTRACAGSPVALMLAAHPQLVG